MSGESREEICSMSIIKLYEILVKLGITTLTVEYWDGRPLLMINREQAFKGLSCIGKS